MSGSEPSLENSSFINVWCPELLTVKINKTKPLLNPESFFLVVLSILFLCSLSRLKKKIVCHAISNFLPPSCRPLSLGYAIGVSSSSDQWPPVVSSQSSNLPSACKSWSLPLLWNIFSSLFQETSCDFPPTSLVAAYWPASLASLLFFFFKLIWWITFFFF